MGNIDSKYQFEHGNVYLQTDKAYFVAGEQITGNIYLSLGMGFPAASLEIEVVGKEKCKWVTRQTKEIKDGDSTKTEFWDVWHKNEKKVITYKVPVYYFPGGMAPAGQYTFPFSFALPSNLPASIYYWGFDKASAYIKYKIKAVMEPTMGLTVKKMKFKQPLVIRQPANVSAMAPTQTDERNVYACCCFGNKGVARITTQFEKDGYCPDEVCRAMADVDNSQCTGEITSMTIRLEQHVELKAKDGLTFTDNRILESKDFDGLAANSNTGGLNRFLELNLAGIRQQARPFDDVKPLSADDLYLAERMQPSSHGNAVKLWYTLTVKCNYGTCWAEEPHCTIPLTITPPPLPSFGRVEAPAGWSPTVFNTFEFNLPGPGEILSAVTVAPVMGNISVNIGGNVATHEEVKMHMNIPPPTMGLSLDIDQINAEVPVPIPAPIDVGMNIPAPTMNVEVTDYTHAAPGQVDMNVNMGGMGMNVDMQVEGNATYYQETTVNGATTSMTTHGDVHDVNMGVGVGDGYGGGIGVGGGVAIEENDDNVQMQANIGVPGMNMGINMNIDD